MSRFLRFVVVRTLAGDRESLKESVIGNELRQHPEFRLSTITSYPGSGQFDPGITADGRQVAFSWAPEAGHNANIYVAAADGGAPKRVTTGTDADDMPSWSPDGSELVF